jgi:hypothetical protein
MIKLTRQTDLGFNYYWLPFVRLNRYNISFGFEKNCMYNGVEISLLKYRYAVYYFNLSHYKSMVWMNPFNEKVTSDWQWERVLFNRICFRRVAL